MPANAESSVAPRPVTPQSTPARRAARWTSLAVIGLLACYVTLGLTASSQKSQTCDEGAHLAGGVSYWAFNDYRIEPNNGNWPQRLCGLPVWLSGYRFPSIDTPAWREMRQWDLGDQFVYQSGNDADGMLLRGRAMTSILGVLLGLLIYFWSSRLFGRLGGVLSLALFALSPAMLAHGFLITADMASALCFTAAVGALWMLLHRISLLVFLANWLALSGLFLSKFSAPAIVPIGLLLLAVRLCNGAPLVMGQNPGREIHGRTRQLAHFAAAVSMLAIAVVTSIWASYGFRYAMINPALDVAEAPVPWSNVEVESPLVSHAVGFARDYHLLPEAYLFGFAHLTRSSQAHNAFFNGEFRLFGWLGFFPYCLAAKTPWQFFVIVATAAGALWRYRRATEVEQTGKEQRSPGLLYEFAPLLVWFVVYWAFVLTSHMNTGHRYLLPTYPPLFIFAGAAAWWFRPPANRHIVAAGPSIEAGRRMLTATMRAVVASALLLSAIEAIWFWPHYLAYFNLLDGGPRYAYRHLVDSSLDWSQDLKGVKPWLDAHPADAQDERRLYFSFFGGAPPEYYGIHATPLPFFPERWHPHLPDPLTGGTYLISASMLNGVFTVYTGRWNQSYERQYQQVRQAVESFRAKSQTDEGRQELLRQMPEQKWNVIFWAYDTLRFSRLCSYLRAREPDDEIGYSILVYRLTDDYVDRALDGPPIELLDMPETEAEELRRKTR